MKILITVITLILSTVSLAHADYFQFVDRAGNNYLRFWSVSLAGQSIGTTDGYGRVQIGGTKGRHLVTLKHHGKKIKNITLKVDGRDGLKVVVVP